MSRSRWIRTSPRRFPLDQDRAERRGHVGLDVRDRYGGRRRGHVLPACAPEARVESARRHGRVASRGVRARRARGRDAVGPALPRGPRHDDAPARTDRDSVRRDAATTGAPRGANGCGHTRALCPATSPPAPIVVDARLLATDAGDLAGFDASSASPASAPLLNCIAKSAWAPANGRLSRIDLRLSVAPSGQVSIAQWASTGAPCMRVRSRSRASARSDSRSRSRAHARGAARRAWPRSPHRHRRPS